jgi:hypothetical protein
MTILPDLAGMWFQSCYPLITTIAVSAFKFGLSETLLPASVLRSPVRSRQQFY